MDNCYSGQENLFILLNGILQRTLWQEIIGLDIFFKRSSKYMDFFVFCFRPLMDIGYSGKENLLILLNGILQSALWQELLGLGNLLKKFQINGRFCFWPLSPLNITCSFQKLLYNVPRR